jgi:site-specific recombinase XerD
MASEAAPTPIPAQQTAAEHAYREFVDSLTKSPATRTLYVQALHYFTNYLGVPRDSYDKLVDKDPKIIQMNISDFIKSLGKRGLSYATVSSYCGALKKFYDQNDIITINWKKIRGFMGEHEKVAEDRSYTHGEISTLLSHTNLRNRGIILMMCSAGLRLNGIPQLRMRDLEAIDDYGIYKVTVYAKSKKWRYTTYCTPECRNTIEEYIATRRRWGERITDDSPIFRIDYNIYKTTEANQFRHMQ